MKSVIDRSRLDRHSIDKYKFKVLAFGAEKEVAVTEKPVSNASEKSATIPNQKSAEAEDAATGNRDELVESLLKKADEMSSNVIKMQMKLEDAEASYKVQLETERERAYEEGVQAGRDQLLHETEQAQKAGVEQFAVSVKTLEERSGEFAKALDAIQEELVHAAIDIAKEVILVEAGERSGSIARKMATQLIEELQGASKITLRVNPADHGAVSEAVGSLEHIEIVSDSAVNRGGVIAVSNVGNIDAEVMKRFERVKKAALLG